MLAVSITSCLVIVPAIKGVVNKRDKEGILAASKADVLPRAFYEEFHPSVHCILNYASETLAAIPGRSIEETLVRDPCASLSGRLLPAIPGPVYQGDSCPQSLGRSLGGGGRAFVVADIRLGHETFISPTRPSASFIPRFIS